MRSNGALTGANGTRQTQLSSGLRVVTESLPELRSVAVGFWVGTGSRDETGTLSGASHFLEHLLFKGTPTRTAREVTGAIESVGGEMNAFTTHEYTAFYVRVPDHELPLAIEILSDVIHTPAFREDEVESERQVILEEIRMRDDTPDDVVHEQFAGAMFPSHPLGLPVLGSVDSIVNMQRDDIAAYHGAHYRAENIVVAVAGNQEHEEVVRLLEKSMHSLSGARPASARDALHEPLPVVVHARDTEQAHVVLGMRGMARDDPDRYAWAVLNQVLGGGMSSRLFQEVRERRGLAYSVYSYRGAYRDTGVFGVYAGTAPSKIDEVLGIINDEFDSLIADGGVSDDELSDAKGHLAGSMALSLESSASRMHRIGRSLLTTGEVPALDDVVADVTNVTADDVARVIERVIAGANRTLSVVGPFTAGDFA